MRLFEQKTSTRDPGQRAWQANPEEEARAETFKQAGGVDWLSWARNNFQEIRRLQQETLGGTTARVNNSGCELLVAIGTGFGCS